MVRRLFAVLLMLFPTVSWSAVLTFTDRATWQAAVGAIQTETLRGLPHKTRRWQATPSCFPCSIS